MVNYKKLVKQFIEGIPDNKLNDGFSNDGGTIYDSVDLRLDMQGVSVT